MGDSFAFSSVRFLMSISELKTFELQTENVGVGGMSRAKQNDYKGKRWRIELVDCDSCDLQMKVRV